MVLLCLCIYLWRYLFKQTFTHLLKCKIRCWPNIMRFYRLFFCVLSQWGPWFWGKFWAMQLGETTPNLPFPENSHFSPENKPVVSPQKFWNWGHHPSQFFHENFQGLPTFSSPGFKGTAPFVLPTFSNFSVASPRFGPFDATRSPGISKGWDPFSDTERPKCHGAKLKRGEVLHVPRNAWFTLRALRRGWNLGEPRGSFPRGVFGQWMWEREMLLELRVLFV